jgi:protein arginine kinase
MDYVQRLRNSWYNGCGADSDVVISSRTRLARNLIDHPFPAYLSSADEAVVMQQVVRAFGKLPAKDNFAILYLKDLPPLERRMLFERNIVTQAFSLEGDKAVAMSLDGSISAMINEQDHIRMSCIKGGFSLQESYQAVNRVDNLLEDTLNYAISLEWGYLNSSLTDIGTGMRASLMVHLPALVIGQMINKAIKAITQIGFSVKGFFGEGGSSLGSLYQISNQISFGLSEEEILENLRNVVQPLISYERKARTELADRKKVELEDKIYRALGILTYCRSITSKEAMELLSYLRLGIIMGLITEIAVEMVTSLFFLVQKSHIQKIRGGVRGGVRKQIDRMRAAVIRESLRR